MMFWTDNNVALIEIVHEGRAIRVVRWTHYMGLHDLWTLQFGDREFLTTENILKEYGNSEIKIIATVLPELMVPKGEEAKYENNR